MTLRRLLCFFLGHDIRAVVREGLVTVECARCGKLIFGRP